MSLSDLPTLADLQSSRRATPKGKTRKQVKGKKDRAEATVEKAVRAACVSRDGFCRVNLYELEGLMKPATDLEPGELAHMHHKRRSKTRGLPPEERHSRTWCLMLCRSHHRRYDAKTLTIERLTDRGADGPLRFTYKGRSYSE